jgi:predicted lipoprotein
VLDDWRDGHRDDFVAGIDGDRQMSLDELVNELIFRVTEIDEQGLRDMVEASAPADLAPTRADGPAAFRLAEHKATYAGVARLLDAGGLQQLVDAVSTDTGERLAEATASADEAMAALPDSVTAAFDDHDALAAADEAVAALKVLLTTEVASQLGITISFSDSDGDS